MTTSPLPADVTARLADLLREDVPYYIAIELAWRPKVGSDGLIAAQYLPAGNGGSVVFGTTAGTVAQGNDTRITGAAQKSANLSDLASAQTARSNLGLGTAAQSNANSFEGGIDRTGSSVGQVPVLGNGGVLGFGNVPGTYLFSSATASVVASAAVQVANNQLITLCRLSCTGAPSGADLVVTLQRSTDGGTNWNTLQTLTVSSGTSTPASATPNAVVNAGDLLRVNASSVGGSTGVLFQANYA